MYSRVSAASYGTVSALWNLAYDGGMGVGAACFGLLAAHLGYAWGFVLTGLLMLGALVPALRDGREGGDDHPPVRAQPARAAFPPRPAQP
ncbi:hypothetical protein ACPCA8_30050 [Streptomyces capoamus]|uniref:hypothetical protein n=2 Tax=Streptomyces capoamus TaxID=68183 RepID=UPI003C2AF60C